MPDRPQPPHVHQWRQVLNEHWPQHPEAFTDRDPINVRVRIVWDGGDEEYLPGQAVRWDTTHVYVRVQDPHNRFAGQGVWVKPADVYTRPVAHVPPATSGQG